MNTSEILAVETGGCRRQIRTGIARRHLISHLRYRRDVISVNRAPHSRPALGFLRATASRSPPQTKPVILPLIYFAPPLSLLLGSGLFGDGPDERGKLIVIPEGRFVG